jgi:hypothetical protein
MPGVSSYHICVPSTDGDWWHKRGAASSANYLRIEKIYWRFFKKKQGLSEFCPKGKRGSDGYKPVPHRTGTSDTLSSYFSTISKRLRPAQKYFVPMRPPPPDSKICPFFLKKYDRDNAEERSMGMEGVAWVQIALSVSGPIQSCHSKIRNLLNSVKNTREALTYTLLPARTVPSPSYPQ